MLKRIIQYWFLLGLFLVCLFTLADTYGILGGSGRWLKQHHGPDLVIVLIFFFSGLALSPEQFRDGLMDVEGIILTVFMIFIVAPLLAALFGLIPMNTGIIIGLFLVAIMPSTLSSGVVMTHAAGGSAAHALVTTVIANNVSIFTIPYWLSFLLMVIGEATTVTIDKSAIMLKIGILVILPLAVGMTVKGVMSSAYERIGKKISILNQCLILFIVWIALSQTRTMLLNSGYTVFFVLLIVFSFHGFMLMGGWLIIRLFKREKGRRESILFLGGQKTLPLSIVLQVSLFPQYELALLVCVLHHIVHLAMDGYVVERLKLVGTRQGRGNS